MRTEPNDHSFSLLTDLYQLTMALAAWKQGMQEHEAVFHMSFRQNPFKGGYALACGQDDLAAFVDRFRLTPGDIEFLRSCRASDGNALFPADFLGELAMLRLTVDIDAVPEGTPVFPHEPVLRVRGPYIQCQLLETPLLNLVNFQTLVATKASRMCHAAGGDPVIEFGLRRAQGPDGALSASRAAYIGGVAGTSNVMAGKLFGIPVRGTHAHSWVMSFDSELEAFRALGEAMPNNCLFLVDTYDTLQGVRNAITVGRELRSRGHEMTGIRLDSGDLAWLSVEARRLLDEAGFERAIIIASNDLDEHLIESLRSQGARIDAWGVGTNLVTGGDQAALGGVYKLGAMRSAGGNWQGRLKLSEQAAKISTPGILQVRRYQNGEGLVADMIYDELHAPIGRAEMVDPMDPTRRRRLGEDLHWKPLLQPLVRKGRRAAPAQDLATLRDHAASQLQLLHGGLRRFLNPHRYPVGLELGLHERKTRQILAMRAKLDARDSS